MRACGRPLAAHVWVFIAGTSCRAAHWPGDPKQVTTQGADSDDLDDR